MVVTRKRSCSASESATAATGTTRAAKLKKQDDGVGSPAPKTTTPSCSTPTTRRSRRVTDSLVDAAPSSPRPSRATRSSNDSTTQDTRTPVKTRTENSSDGSYDSQGGRQLRVTLRDISTPSTPSTRSRRASGVGAGDLDAAVKSISLDSADVAGISTTVSTPVRRSRRLSGDGVDSSGQGTPKQLSFSIARIIGSEGSKTKEEVASKQTSLPVIKEDTETTSPKKDDKPHAAEGEKITTEKPDQTLQTGCGDEVEELNSSSAESAVHDLPVPVEDKESSSPAPSNKEAESNGKLVDEQTVDSSICDGKLSSTQSIIEDSEGGKKNVAEAEDTEGEKKDVVEVTKTNDGEEEQMTASSDSSIESISKNLKKDAKEEEQNNAISTSDSMEVTTSPVKPTRPEGKHKTAAPKEEVTKESSTTQDTQVTSSAPVDENGNKNLNGISPMLSEIKAGDKKLLKVIPELEKKIEQLRSVPKGQPISGKWWKKEKQRFRSINKDASGKKKWSKKMHLKQWRGDVMARSAVIEAEKQQKKEDLKERQRINKIRREENAKKSEIVQVIKDPRKIKKMKRKQLRYIETRDTTNLKQV
ncbi:coiled-coil domain-containing protein 86-like [Eriocheir sinensis]|uniref:coiled-coil domain-containing protein 86-like n=1 Tax=Eriocheir sinensis TaxID=95602 RepID=UPI0021C9EABD|nr:coiled-coil domain-containing protein 86-like [Eriocheir sinensis]